MLECDELEIAFQGATVTRWTPPHASEVPVLFVSPSSAWRPGKAIRGGVPLCFPWFGPHPSDAKRPQHGFARTALWSLKDSRRDADGGAEARLSLHDSEATRTLWPHSFTAELTVRAAEELSLTLDVTNPGEAPFTFGAALHTYFAVSDVRQVSIRGLEHTDYLDKVDDGKRKQEGADSLRFSGEIDRIYLNTLATCTIDDPGWSRRIVIRKQGSRSTVVWNPWIDKARVMADLGDDDWLRLVCVETGNAADDLVTLPPGATHRMSAEIAIEP